MSSPPEIPTGTVTFLFTDIEGSTRLAQAHPDALPSLLARHHELLNAAARAHRGYVFRVIGDSFCVAFHAPGDAIRSAIEAQRSLNMEKWQPAPIRVRMGIHTGKADYEQSSDYHGYLAMSHVQRLMSAAHGGQVLLSEATQELVRDELPQGVSLLDMGEARLKDVVRPEHIYQVVAEGLPSEFPPIKTLQTARHNLPAQLTSFVGREKELDEVEKILSAHRLVTLTGTGGAGKTRLSLEVARGLLGRYSGGAWLAELGSISSPALIMRSLLSVFGLHEDAQRGDIAILIDHLQERSALLLLDNCEHLVDAVAQIAELLLQACPNLSILATSREALGIPGEIAYHVPSMSTPDPEHLPAVAELAAVDSIRLLVERAAAVKPGFALTAANAKPLAEICLRLDGIPLAIELAAARMKVLSPEQTSGRLDDRFQLLTGGYRTALPRQQTLRATIDWSYSLLSESEKVLFRRLAVFAGGWTLQAAEAVCNERPDTPDVLDLLTRLVDKSLVFVETPAGEARYRRLETIRQYSRERLSETNEAEALRDRHLQFFTLFAEAVDENLKGRDQDLWQKRMAIEFDNVRAALEWGLIRDPDAALRIVGAANLFLTASGYSAEGFRWTKAALERVDKAHRGPGVTEEQRRAARAKALCGLTRLDLSLGDNAGAKRAAEQSVALYRQTEDRRGLAFALVILAYPLEFLGERAEAEAALQESYAIARPEGDTYVICRALNRLARVIMDLHNDLRLPETYLEESIRRAQEAGLRSQEAQAIGIRGMLASRRGDLDAARRDLEQAVEIYDEIGAPFNVMLEKSNIAHLERRIGNYPQALHYYRETIVGFRDIGQMGAVAHQLECFGFIALAQHRNERALQLMAAAQGLREKSGMTMTPDEQVDYDHQLETLRARMDPARFTTLWAEAATLKTERAIELALA